MTCKFFFASFVSFLFLVSFVHGFGVGANYQDERPLYMYPGQTTDVDFYLGNTGVSVENRAKGGLVAGTDIAEIVNPQEIYIAPPNENLPIKVRVTIPSNASIGKGYTISLALEEITGTSPNGMITMGAAVKRTIPVVIVENPEKLNDIIAPDIFNLISNATYNITTSKNILNFTVYANDTYLKSVTVMWRDMSLLENNLYNYMGSSESLGCNTSDGNCIITSEATDFAGNKANTSYLLIIDNTPPIIQTFFSDAINNYSSSNQTINFTLIAYDENILSAILNGTEMNNGEDGLTFSLNAKPLDWNCTFDGPCSLLATITDKAGLTSDFEYILTVDNIGKPQTSVNNPGVFWMPDDFNITLTSIGAMGYGVDYINYTLNGVFGKIAGNSSNILVNLSGNNTLNFYAVDFAGNIESVKTINALLDKDEPKIEAGSNIYSKTGINTTHANNRIIIANASSAAMILEYIWLSNSTDIMISDNQSLSTLINASVDGVYSIILNVTNKINNLSSSDNFSLIRDTTPPIITNFSLSVNMVYIGETIIASCNATDNLDPTPTILISGIDTTLAGLKTAECNVTDNEGNSNFTSINYTVETKQSLTVRSSSRSGKGSVAAFSKSTEKSKNESSSIILSASAKEESQEIITSLSLDDNSQQIIEQYDLNEGDLQKTKQDTIKKVDLGLTSITGNLIKKSFEKPNLFSTVIALICVGFIPAIWLYKR